MIHDSVLRWYILFMHLRVLPLCASRKRIGTYLNFRFYLSRSRPKPFIQTANALHLAESESYDALYLSIGSKQQHKSGDVIQREKAYSIDSMVMKTTSNILPLTRSSQPYRIVRAANDNHNIRDLLEVDSPFANTIPSATLCNHFRRPSCLIAIYPLPIFPQIATETDPVIASFMQLFEL